jgi:hypothetical protein
MSTSTEFRNCGPLCAEILGGHCPGDSCPYRPTDALPWSEFDERIVEYRRLERHMQRSFRHGLRLGFWCGVMVTLAAYVVLAILEWILR